MPDEDYGEPRGTAPPAGPADDRELPAGVIDNGGHYEVDPALMTVYPQFATDFEVDRIVTGRLEYLYWVQRHFAERVLPPHPEGGGAPEDG
jgi:hypothetical protein